MKGLDRDRQTDRQNETCKEKESMEATKALMNHHLVTKLELSLESECRVLLQQWTSPHFAHLCKKFLDSNHIHLQKPVNLPL
ncbi:hypothetical protein Pcinc_010933 [Petrolisthes cinctipes]|uniref:Uncharacterized protein n=1 Tax=Petrolisthes cinctipes TaxID=88211 RepID=A0AAE1KWW2_PETCI|nr:hypothetical protein Pcinc_010933 [Petrolisthes cinctipes]